MPAPTLQRADTWAAGANNVAQPNRLPEASAREIVNLDPAVGGTLEMRAGYSKVMACTAGRCAFSVRDSIVVADGGQLLSFAVDTNESTVLGSVVESGPIAGCTLNSTLYLNTLTDSVRTDGATLKPWAIAEPGFAVEVIGGSIVGVIKVAVTATGADGEESGATPAIVNLGAGSGVRVVSSDPRPLRVYASAPNSEALYYQGLLYGGALALTQIDDSKERLVTGGLVVMPACEELAAYHSVILGRLGNCVYFTAPMHPHLMDPIAGFFQYGAPVTVMAVTDMGVFVVADKTYFLTGLETAEPTQRVVLEMDAVAGTAVALPDGRAAWFTRYGQAVGSQDGAVQLPNRATFAPDIAAAGAAGFIDHNGLQMVVTTMRGTTTKNNLATGDFADLETDDGQ